MLVHAFPPLTSLHVKRVPPRGRFYLDEQDIAFHPGRGGDFIDLRPGHRRPTFDRPRLVYLPLDAQITDQRPEHFVERLRAFESRHTIGLWRRYRTAK